MSSAPPATPIENAPGSTPFMVISNPATPVTVNNVLVPPLKAKLMSALVLPAAVNKSVIII